jgi:hypothetical protein
MIRRVVFLCLILIILLVAMPPTPLKLPVVFKNQNMTKEFNRQPDGRGREGDSIGVWRDGSSAWKLYPKHDHFMTVSTHYQQAAVHGLPMGDPGFREGSVQQGTDKATNGFALVTRWLEGQEFNFHTPPKPFKVALRDQKISNSRSSTQYKRYVCISMLIRFLVELLPESKVDALAPIRWA